MRACLFWFCGKHEPTISCLMLWLVEKSWWTEIKRPSRRKSFMMNPVWPNLPIWMDAWLFYSVKNVDDKFTFAMLHWLTGRSLLALNKDGFHHLMMTCLFLLIGPRSGLVSKGRIFWPGPFSILALSNKGGGRWRGLTRAKIFLVELVFNIHSVQITNPSGAKPNQKLAHDLSKLLHAFPKLQISAFFSIF